MIEGPGGTHEVVIVVAVARNGVIGADGDLPWRLPADLARFKQLTMGCQIVMGRATHESIGRALPGRVNIVLTRDRAWRPTDASVQVAHDLEAGLWLAAQHAEVGKPVCVIGGGRVYEAALPWTDRIEQTLVEAEVEGDTRFPDLGEAWELVHDEVREADAANAYAMRFQTLQRHA